MRTPPNPDSFYAIVWDIVRQVPPGRVTTYGQIASMIRPLEDTDPVTYDRFGAQWVGSAMNAAPDGVPWQRVINSKGEISLPEPTGTRQRQMLESEGIAFDAKGRVNFDQCAWDGPPVDWLDDQGLAAPLSLKKGKPDTPHQPSLL